MLLLVRSLNFKQYKQSKLYKSFCRHFSHTIFPTNFYFGTITRKLLLSMSCGFQCLMAMLIIKIHTTEGPACIMGHYGMLKVKLENYTSSFYKGLFEFCSFTTETVIP